MASLFFYICVQPERILGGEYGIHSEVWSLGVSVLEVSLCTKRERERESTNFNSADLALCRWH